MEVIEVIIEYLPFLLSLLCGIVNILLCRHGVRLEVRKTNTLNTVPAIKEELSGEQIRLLIELCNKIKEKIQNGD